jgi:hypothetical protein
MQLQLGFCESLPPGHNSPEMLLPLVVDEGSIHRFSYWNQKIHHGMRHKNELYMLYQSYTSQERLKAYADAYEQAEQGEKVCITVSKARYCVWLDLRSL